MANNNKTAQNLSGDVLPAVYISNVSLRDAKLSDHKEPKTSSPRATQAPPPREAALKPYIGTPSNVGLNGLPQTPVAIKNKTNTISALETTIEFTIRDVVQKESIDTWLFNNYFTKFLNIKVIQSTNEELSKELSRGKISAIRSKKFKNFARQKIIPVQKDDIKKTKGDSIEFDLKDYSSFVPDTGERVYEIPYETTFVLKDSKPRHLAYYAFVYMDMEAMATAYGISMHSSKFVKGRIAAEEVISKGSVRTTSFIFFVKETNQLWSGPKHRSRGRKWYTGKKNSLFSKELLVEEVPNKKIDDFREVDDLKARDLMLKTAQRLSQKLQKKQINRDRISIDSSDSYISDGIVSSKPDGRVDLIFHADLRKLVRTQSAFGSIFDATSNRRTREEIYLLSNIKSLKITRRRVKNVSSLNRLGTPVLSNLFDSSREIEEVIIYSSDEDGTLKKMSTESAGLKEVDSIAFLEGIRTFTATDSSIKELTDGIYQYGAIIEVEDGTIKFLNQKLDRLKQVKDKLWLYYVDSLIPRYIRKNGKFNVIFAKKYKNIARSTGTLLPWVEAIAVFVDVYTSIANYKKSPRNLAKKLNSMANPKTGSSEGIGALLDLIDEVINKLEDTLGGKRYPSQSALNLSKHSSPNQFKVSTMTIDRRFKDLHDSNMIKNVGVDFLGSDDRQDIGVKGVLVKDYINRIDQENSIYWKSTNLSNVSSALKKEYRNSTEVPADKTPLFNMSDTEWSYLTPSTIRGGSYTIDRLDAGKTLWEHDKYNAMASNIVATKTGNFLNPKQVPNALSPETKSKSLDTNKNNIRTQVQDSSLMNILSQAGVTLVEVGDPLKKGEAKTRDKAKTSASAVFSPGNPILEVQDFDKDTDTLDIEARKASAMNKINTENARAVGNIFVNHLSSTGNLNKPSPQSKSIPTQSSRGAMSQGNYDLASANNIVDNIRKSPLKAADFEKIPNQVRSLMFSNSNQTKNNFLATEQDLIKSPETSQMMKYNFDTFGKVQVLAGFSRDSQGNYIINKPKFIPLQQKILQRASNLTVLCKIDNYQNRELGIGLGTASRMKIYDNCFLMSTDQLTLLLAKRKKLARKVEIQNERAKNDLAKKEKRELVETISKPGISIEVEADMIKADEDLLLSSLTEEAKERLGVQEVKFVSSNQEKKKPEQKKEKQKNIEEVVDLSESIGPSVEEELLVELDLEEMMDMPHNYSESFPVSDNEKSTTFGDMSFETQEEEEEEEESQKGAFFSPKPSGGLLRNG